MTFHNFLSIDTIRVVYHIAIGHLFLELDNVKLEHQYGKQGQRLATRGQILDSRASQTYIVSQIIVLFVLMLAYRTEGSALDCTVKVRYMDIFGCFAGTHVLLQRYRSSFPPPSSSIIPSISETTARDGRCRDNFARWDDLEVGYLASEGYHILFR